MAAKNHPGYPAGSVTLISQELIGRYSFCNKTTFHIQGSNHWGSSGLPNSTLGLRPFLNSLDKSVYSYAGDGFWSAFSEDFKEAVMLTTVPNITQYNAAGDEWLGGEYIQYTTSDHVFVLSYTEMGFTFSTIPDVGSCLEYFTSDAAVKRAAVLGDSEIYYWSRTPWSNQFSLYAINGSIDGSDYGLHNAIDGSTGVRPALNLKGNTFVSAQPDEEGVYQIIWTPPIIYGDLNDDSAVNVADAILVLRSVVGLVTLDDLQRHAADVNGDSTVDVSDAILILRKIVGLIPKFPVE